MQSNEKDQINLYVLKMSSYMQSKQKDQINLWVLKMSS